MKRQFVPKSNRSRVPLSYAQRGLWLSDGLQAGGAAYNVPIAFRISGPLDRGALECALNALMRRHDALRSSVEVVDGLPHQRIHERCDLQILFEDLAHTEASEGRARAEAAIKAECDTRFDLSVPPLLRVRVLQLTSEAFLLMTVHHIIFDASSESVLCHELGALYDDAIGHRASPLRPLPIQYADYAAWQHESLSEAALQSGLEYWKRQLHDVPVEPVFQVDKPRVTRVPKAAVHRAVVNREILDELKQRLGHKNVTLYTALLSIFALLLSKYSSRDDIVVGVPFSDRRDPRLESVIGFVVNTLPIRMLLGAPDTWEDLLKHVSAVVLDAIDHAYVPFERIVEAVSPPRMPHVTPLFQILFVLHASPRPPLPLAGLQVERLDCFNSYARYELEVHLQIIDGALEMVWLYDSSLCDAWRIEQMARHFTAIAEMLGQNALSNLHRLCLLTPAEWKELNVWNNTQVCDSMIDTCIHSIVEAQAARTPLTDAVIGATSRLTYGSLNERANRIARRLIEVGVTRETRVAVLLGRDSEMVAAILGVLKAGAAYVPMDPRDPVSRWTYVVANSGAVVLLTDYTGASFDPGPQVQMLNLSDPAERLRVDWLSPLNLDIRSRPANLAYVIYTSGSTGTPKGVMIEHRSIVNFAADMVSRLPMRRGDVVGAITTLSFDIAALELLAPLTVGATVRLIPLSEPFDAHEVATALSAQPLSLVQTTPSTWHALLDSGWIGGPRSTAICGGEALSSSLAQRLLAKAAAVWNLYGPTETTVWSSAHRVASADDVALGRPLANTVMYVLDADLQPVPRGGIGELYIGGAGLARGYAGRPSLTAERFVANPFASEPGSRLYRTGDIVRRRKDNRLEYVGRYDHQVKIRGVRVELGEIEEVLKRNDLVRDAAVVVHGTGEYARLIAYVETLRAPASDAHWQSGHVEEWRRIFDATYLESGGEFDVSGWQSSYSKQPIAIDDMREWVAVTVATLAKLRPRRVLEVGCGTGLLVTRLAPQCETYFGIDISTVAVTQLQSQLAGRPDMSHVSVRQGEAHDLTSFDGQSFDLVILNSVTQYFPDADYLVRVLDEAVRVTDGGGHIYVGDVRSRTLLEAFHTSIQMHRASEDVPLGTVRQVIEENCLNEEELVIDTALFEEYARRHPKVGRAEVVPKYGAYDNEVSRFRVDVMLTVGAKEHCNPSSAIPWDPQGHWRAAVGAMLKDASLDGILVHDIVDGRVAPFIEAARLLQADGDQHKDLRWLKGMAARRRGPSPDHVTDYAADLGVELVWARCSAGAYDAIFRPRFAPEQPVFDADRGWYLAYTNNPSKQRRNDEVAGYLRQYLRAQVPDAMLPRTIVILDALPLTVSGKIDRRALPVPRQRTHALSTEPMAEVEQALSALFAEVLDMDVVGAEENFFDLGGHSLLAVRLIDRIRSVLGKDVALRTFFAAPSVHALSEHAFVQDPDSLSERPA